MPDSHRQVLAYFREMMEVCRLRHRHDLEREYQEAWELACEHVYGRLPSRLETPQMLKLRAMQEAIWNQQTEAKAKEPVPLWRQQILSKPYRKVVARDGDYDILECRHRIYVSALFETAKHKRHRCGECAKAEAMKKGPSSEQTPKAEEASA